MFDSIGHLFKATVAVAVTPIAAVIDIVTLPSSAYENKHPFENTLGFIGMAKDQIVKSIE